MVANANDLLPSAADCLDTLARAEAEREAEKLRAREHEEAEKKALIDHFSKPSGIDDDERMKRAAAIINRAVANGQTETGYFRFPNELCTDHGRAINNQEPGWENTLTGLPKELYDFWHQYLQPRGYRLMAEVVDFPGGLPGDIGIKLAWGVKDESQKSIWR